MKKMLKSLTAVAIAVLTPLATLAAEMYYNRLSKGTEIIPAGTYGTIVVSEGGYKATKFGSSLGTISAATDDFGGAYTKIIDKFGDNDDLADHTISGWFKVPKKESGETTICVEKTSHTSKYHRGNAIRVSADGHLVVGKVNSSDAWQGTDSHITSTDTVPQDAWFYLTVNFTVDHTTRKATAKAYVNGVEIAMPTTAFACNYNGSTCAALKVGDNVECAGLRVDDAVVTDTASMKALAVDPKYVVSGPTDVSCWTGAAGDGDPTNEENWEGGKLPGEETCVCLGGEVYLNAVEGKTFVCKEIVFTNDVMLSETCDWSAMPVAPNMSGHTLDLNGNGLTLSQAMTDGSVTSDAEEVATLTFDVPAGATVQNTSMAINGKLRFVKEGAGTFDGRVAKQLYTGGTVVNEGVITSNESETNLHWGTEGSTVTIEPNGVLDIKSNLSWCYHKIILNGGAISNATGNTKNSAQGLGDIVLTADSTVITKYHTTFSDNRSGRVGLIDLGGHTLEFVHLTHTDDKSIFYFNNVVATNGTLKFDRKAKFNPITATCVDESVSLDMEGDFYLNQTDITVGDFIDGSKGDAQTLENDRRVTVTGRYTPKSDCLVNVALADGATLDLNEQSGTWQFFNRLTTQSLIYGESATITVDVSERELEEGEKLVGWSAEPEGVTFQWDATTEAKGVALSEMTSGIYYGQAIVSARWTNDAADYDIANPENWLCTTTYGEEINDLPTAATEVTFEGDDIAVQITEPVEWASVIFNGAIPEGYEGEVDWSGLKDVPLGADSQVDLYGSVLKLSGFGASANTLVVTNSQEQTTATLVFDIDEGETYENAGIEIDGDIRLIKDGAGTLVGKRQNQLYTGGTVISNGTILAANYEKFYSLGAGGTDITIEPDGTLDSNGQYDWASHRIVLNGGTLQNRGGSMTQEGWGGFGDIVLTDDSKLKLSYHATFNDNDAPRYLDLGGHTLEVEYLSDKGDGKAILYALHTTWMNGTLVMGQDIVLRPYSFANFSNNLTIVCNGDLQLTKADKTFGNLTDNSEGEHDGFGFSITVNGTYKPQSANLHSTVLADGSTLDLTEQTGTWAFTCKEGKDQTLTFADGATITVDISGRTPGMREKIVAWEAKPNATFQWDAATAAAGITAVALEDGLYYGDDPESPDVDKGYWTGAAGDGDPLNPQNWACTNLAGRVVEGGIPTNVAASVVIRDPLTTDLDWTKLGAVNFAAGKVDLAGHTLKLTAFAPTSAALVTNSVDAVAALAIDVGTDNSSTLGGSTVNGNIALDILSGTFQLTSSLGITGGNPNLITVASGATLDQNGVIDMPIAVRLEDEATLTNTGAGQKYSLAQFTGGLSLAEGATAYIDTANQMAFTATGFATMPIDIGSGTLVKRGAGKISVQNAAITGTGKILVEAGELNIGNKGLDIADTITIEVADNAETSTYIWVEASCSVPILAGNGRIAANTGSLTVTKYYSGRLQIGQQGGANQFTKGTLTLGGETTLDLTQIEGAWTEHEKVVFGENATITVDLTGRTVNAGDRVIAWTAQPPSTAKLLPKGSDVYFVRRDDGLYAARSFMIFVR